MSDDDDDDDCEVAEPILPRADDVGSGSDDDGGAGDHASQDGAAPATDRATDHASQDGAVDFFCERTNSLTLPFDLIGSEQGEGRGENHVAGPTIFTIARGRYSAAAFADKMAAGLQKLAPLRYGRIFATVLPVLHLVQLHCGEAAPANLTHDDNPKKLARLVANVLHFQLHGKVQRTANNGSRKLNVCDASDTALTAADWARSFTLIYGGVDKDGEYVAPDDPRRGDKLGDSSRGSKYASKIFALRTCIGFDGTRNQDGTSISRSGQHMVAADWQGRFDALFAREFVVGDELLRLQAAPDLLQSTVPELGPLFDGFDGLLALLRGSREAGYAVSCGSGSGSAAVTFMLPWFLERRFFDVKRASGNWLVKRVEISLKVELAATNMSAKLL
jgi:hypothetical protein